MYKTCQGKADKLRRVQPLYLLVVRFVIKRTYCHTRAAFGEVYHSRVELVLEEVGMGNHRASQNQTGGSHESGSHHLVLQKTINKS